MTRLARWWVPVAIALAACTQAPRATAPTDTPAPTPTTTITSPTSEPEPLIVAVKGDWGASTGAQRAVSKQMCRVRRSEPFRSVLTTGDNFYPTGTAVPENYDRPERCLYEYPGHRWRPALGNHDQNDGTMRALGEDRRWYAWSESGVDFLALDSNAPTDPRQRKFIAETLATSTARIKIAYFHHPPHTSGSVHDGNAAVRNTWGPMFRRHGVTLVLAGHNHLYEHLVVDGMHFVTTGGGGAVLYRCARAHPDLRTCASVHHFVLLTIHEDSIEVRAIDRDGGEVDRFVVRA